MFRVIGPLEMLTPITDTGEGFIGAISPPLVTIDFTQRHHNSSKYWIINYPWTSIWITVYITKKANKMLMTFVGYGFWSTMTYIEAILVDSLMRQIGTFVCATCQIGPRVTLGYILSEQSEQKKESNHSPDHKDFRNQALIYYELAANIEPLMNRLYQLSDNLK